MLQTAVPGLEGQVMKTTMHQDELLYPQEEGQQELGQVRLLLLVNCHLVA